MKATNVTFRAINTIRLGGIAHQFRSIPVDLVEVGAIRRQPDVARAAANGSELAQDYAPGCLPDEYGPGRSRTHEEFEA
jgi:hypothetical protein